jgi:hypothetical protein
MQGCSPSRGVVISLESWSERHRRRVPSRREVEEVLIRCAFQEELLFEGLCDIPMRGGEVQKRLDRTTDALLALMKSR